MNALECLESNRKQTEQQVQQRKQSHGWSMK